MDCFESNENMGVTTENQRPSFTHAGAALEFYLQGAKQGHKQNNGGVLKFKYFNKTISLPKQNTWICLACENYASDLFVTVQQCNGPKQKNEAEMFTKTFLE